MISRSGKSYGGEQGLPSGWPDVGGSQTPLGRHREVGLRETVAKHHETSSVFVS